MVMFKCDALCSWMVKHDVVVSPKKGDAGSIPVREHIFFVKFSWMPKSKDVTHTIWSKK